MKDPDTGKRLARPNPASEWTTTDVPALRIVDDDLWTAVKARQLAVRKQSSIDVRPRINRHRRPKYLFSGLTKCGECGGGYVILWGEKLACFNARSRATCTNRLTISRTEVEQRVLDAVRDKLMRKDLFEEFCREFTRETNRLRMEQRAGASGAQHELGKIEREIRKLIQAIKDGISGASIKNELLALETRQVELERRLQELEPLPRLHASMSDLYRDKVADLCHALQRDERSLTAAREAIRGLIDEVTLEPVSCASP